MTQIIGLMISGYIAPRMISFLSRKGANEEPAIAKIFFAINLIATLILTIGLIASWAPTPKF